MGSVWLLRPLMSWGLKATYPTMFLSLTLHLPLTSPGLFAPVFVFVVVFAQPFAVIDFRAFIAFPCFMGFRAMVTIESRMALGPKLTREITLCLCGSVWFSAGLCWSRGACVVLCGFLLDYRGGLGVAH